MTQKIYQWFGLEPGEEALVGVTLLQSFLLGIPRILTPTIAGALFLNSYGADNLPYIYLAASISVPLIGFLYLRFSPRFSYGRAQEWTLAFLGAATIIILLLLKMSDSDWPGALLFVWYEIEFSLLSIVYWSAANRMFTVRQGKRLFGLVSTGEILAAIAGGLLTPWLVQMVGTRNILLLVVAGHGLALINLRYMSRLFPQAFEGAPAAEKGDTPAALEGSSNLGSLLKNKYILLMIAYFSFLTYGAYFLADTTFLFEVRKRYSTENELASFLGSFWAIFGIASLIFHTVLSGRWLNWFGVRGSLLTSPLVLLGAAGLLILAGQFPDSVGAVFWCAAGMKLMERLFAGSVASPAYNVLYQPLSVRRKTEAQSATEAVVGPALGGLAALILLYLTKGLGIGVMGLAIAALPLMLLWAVVAFFTNGFYKREIESALSRRDFVVRDLNLKDPHYRTIIEKGLYGERVDETLYCLELAILAEHPALSQTLKRLSHRPENKVRAAAYAAFEKRGAAEDFAYLQERERAEWASEVRESLFRALGATGGEQALPLLAHYVRDEDENVRRGVLAGLSVYCGPAGLELAQGEMDTLLESEDPRDAAFAAGVAGASGRLKNHGLWSRLITLLDHRKTRREAREALAGGGESVLGALQEGLVREGQYPDVRREIIRLYGRLGGEKSTALLLQCLLDPDYDIRLEVLRSLRSLGYQAGGPEHKQMESQLESEIIYNGRIQVLLDWVGQEPGAAELLRDAIIYKREKSRERGFLLLAALYPPESVLRAWHNYQDGSPTSRDLALELLENLLSRTHRDLIFQILDPPEVNETLAEEILERPEFTAPRWLQTCLAFKRAPAGEKLAPEVERVLFLRETEIFARIPNESLARLAGSLTERTLEQGETLFLKGETGSTLFVVMEGVVRIHDGDKTVARLGSGQILGEQAAIDPEPRSFSASAEEFTRLLEMSRETLLDMLGERIEIARGILQTLCARMREAVIEHSGETEGETEAPAPAAPVPDESSESLSILERVIALKTGGVFSGLPENILAEVAARSQEKMLRKGDVLFKKGDLGTTMYVVVRGRVSVYDESGELDVLGERAVFGELAAISSEPRTASIAAQKDTLLLSLDQFSLLDIMRYRTEVVQNIMVVLVRRLRDRRR